MQYLIQREHNGFSIWSLAPDGAKLKCLALTENRRTAQALVERLQRDNWIFWDNPDGPNAA